MPPPRSPIDSSHGSSSDILCSAPGPTLAVLFCPELPSLAEEIIEEIRKRVPEYDRPLEGRFGAGLRRGVTEGLRRFITQVVDAKDTHYPRRDFYCALGRGEFLQGRTLEALHAAYLIGAHIAWRRLSYVGHQANIPADQINLLADRLFAHVEEITAWSAEGYAELRARASSPLQDRRIQLLRLLISGPASATQWHLLELAREAQWPIPETISCVAVEAHDTSGRLPPGLDPDVLVDLTGPDPCLIVPNPRAHGRYRMLCRGLNNIAFSLGPTVPITDAASSLRLARRALTLMHEGVLPAGGHVLCDDHLSTLHLLGDQSTMRILSRRALAAFAHLKPGQRTRLQETLLVWLSTGSSMPAVAVRLRLHPQTVRYRMRSLENLFGDRLHDPDWRFEMEMALRTWQLTHRDVTA